MRALGPVEVERLVLPGGVALRAAASRAARALDEGALVFHPTETVYGIGGDGSATTNELIARIKRRSAEQPLILLTPDVEAVRGLVSDLEWTEEAEALAERFWPGALTLVLTCGRAPAGLKASDGGVAVRVTANPVVRAIFEARPAPMTSTSANLAGEKEATTCAGALELLVDRKDLDDGSIRVVAIDAGPCIENRPSTVVSLVGSPLLIRAGPITKEELREVLPEMVSQE